MTILGDVLRPVNDPVRVDEPTAAKLISVRLHGRGAVRRAVGDGKAPRPFVGNRGRAGQFVFSRIWARRGAMAVIPDDLDGVVVSNEFPLFDVDGRRVDASYLKYWVQTPRFLAELERVSAGASGQNRVKEAAFLGLEIPLPPLKEQRRIAALLDHAAALRAKRRQVLVHLENLTRAIFIEFFSLPPDGTLPLAELAEKVVVGHVGPTSVHFRPSGVPFIRTGNVGHGEVLRSDLAHVTENFHSLLKKSQLRGGDVLISRVITNEVRAAILPHDLNGANCGNIILVRPSEAILAETVLGFLGLPATQQALLGRRVGSAQGVVNTTVLKELPTPVCSIEAQKDLARQIRAIGRQRAAVKRDSLANNELFASLQARAFRGEL